MTLFTHTDSSLPGAAIADWGRNTARGGRFCVGVATDAVQGDQALLRKLKALDADVKKSLKRATLAGAEQIADAADPLAPAPRINAVIEKATAGYVTAAIGPDDAHWYWKFYETGAQPHEIPGPLLLEYEGRLHLVGGASHPGMGARPFLRPAFDATANGENSLAARVVGEMLNKVILGLCESK
jgi:HK97 gp10 family phage protein